METGIIRKPSVWLYAENKTDRIDEMFAGWAAGILTEEAGWFQIITHYGYRGYIKKEEIRRCALGELQKRDQTGSAIYINRAFTDVMKEPNVRAEILCTLRRGCILTAYPDIQNGYRKVLLPDKREGFVPAIACKKRLDSDGYFYNKKKETFFQNQKINLTEQEFREKVVFTAKGYLGTQYRWAGKSPEGIDCSGLTFMSYMLNGVLIYRDAEWKDAYPVHTIAAEKLKPGDLLYFPEHIAMYLGDKKYIHATGNKSSFSCVINSLSKRDWDYREDLAESLLAAGSVW